MATAEERKASNLNFQQRRIEADGALSFLQQQIAEERAKRREAEEMIEWLIELSLRGNKPTGRIKTWLAKRG